MRITGGVLKGRRLASPKGLGIRPTPQKVREAIFDIIGQDLSGLNVLDLFAGTGNLGLEALSRGAGWVLFIDNAPESIRILQKNLALCGLQGSAVVLRQDLRRGIPFGHPMMKKSLDLVFLDPPYGEDLIPRLLADLAHSKALSAASIVIAESSRTEELPLSLGTLDTVKTRLYGDTKITIYTHEART